MQNVVSTHSDKGIEFFNLNVSPYELALWNIKYENECPNIRERASVFSTCDTG
jgi:hypothetical protein